MNEVKKAKLCLSVSLSIRYTIWIVVVFGIRLILLSPVCSDKRSNGLIIANGMSRCRCPQISISFCTSTNRLTATTFGQATLTQTFSFRTHRTNLWVETCRCRWRPWIRVWCWAYCRFRRRYRTGPFKPFSLHTSWRCFWTLSDTFGCLRNVLCCCFCFLRNCHGV